MSNEQKEQNEAMFRATDNIEKIYGALTPIEKSIAWLAYSMARVDALREVSAGCECGGSGLIAIGPGVRGLKRCDKCQKG